MKLKEIKPGMVIRWESEHEKVDLLEELERLGYEWYGTHRKPSDVCGDKCIGHVIHVYNDNGYKNITHSNNLEKVTHNFSDLIISELTAVEVVEWICKHYCDREFNEVFDGDFTMDELYDVMTPDEVVRRITKWKTDHEKKEPEIETVDVCRIIKILPDRKMVVHEEDIKSELPFGGDERQKVEEILKKYCMEHDGEYIAVHEVVSRVKAVK